MVSLRLYVCLLVVLVPSLLPAQAPLYVSVSAYSSGSHTASGLRPRPGMIALSRDLERHFKAHFGDTILLDTLGSYTFQDRMPWTHWHWYRRVDIYMPSRLAAIHFGVKHGIVLRFVAASRHGTLRTVTR